MSRQTYRYLLIPQPSAKLTGRYTRYQAEAQIAVSHSTPPTPGHGTYGHLLFDPRWKTKRALIIARDQACCVICSSSNELQVHHRQYQFIKQAKAFKMPWDYADHLLITLCKNCHQRGHHKFKVPTIII